MSIFKEALIRCIWFAGLGLILLLIHEPFGWIMLIGASVFLIYSMIFRKS